MAEEGVQVIERALNLLETIADSRGPIELNALTSQTGLSKSTVRRILMTLMARGYVEKLPDGTYTMGSQYFATGARHINSLELQSEARSYLASLRNELGLIAYLGVLDGTDASYIGKEALALNEYLYAQVGYRTPAYCSSIGKCLLACLSKRELETVLYDMEFKALTPKTLTNERDLVADLHETRRRGWAIDDEEYSLDHRCIAAPVYNYRGDAIAAVGVSGTTENMPAERIGYIAAQVVGAADAISHRMGYLG